LNGTFKHSSIYIRKILSLKIPFFDKLSINFSADETLNCCQSSWPTSKGCFKFKSSDNKSHQNGTLVMGPAVGREGDRA